MDKLRKGDYVMALPETDGRYYVTNYSNGYRGYVTRVKRDGSILVDTRRESNDGYVVDPKYFKQINEQDPERDLTPPDTDIFAALF